MFLYMGVFVFNLFSSISIIYLFFSNVYMLYVYYFSPCLCAFTLAYGIHFLLPKLVWDKSHCIVVDS